MAVSFASLTSLGRVTPAFAAARWDTRFQVSLDLELGSAGGGRARRPYVAVWVEDAQGLPVRTLAVWVQRTGRGPRWIADLRRWVRQYSGGDALLATVSTPTRAAGAYTLSWDGRNDSGALVEQGSYFVCVEAAREHGTYQLARQSFAFAARPFEATIPGNVEVRTIQVRFHERG